VVLVIVVFYVLMNNTNEFIKIVFNRNMYACIAGAYILLMITKNETENIGYKILEFKPLVFIGKISYSMYLWHSLIPHVTYCNNTEITFAIRLAILIALSSASYYLMEKPLLSLKKYAK